ncbi:MAG: rRNA maturation RNase YbeY [Armatimonadota bacterium]
MSTADIEIDVRNVQQLPAERALATDAARATVELMARDLGEVGGGGEEGREQVQVSILLTNDAHIAELNREYRGLNEPTDVLAFPQSQDDDEGRMQGALGDVVVSVERAYEQAAEAGRSPEAEICELVAHGVLHLVGLEDDTADGRRNMQRRQGEVLADLGLEEAG